MFWVELAAKIWVIGQIVGISLLVIVLIVAAILGLRSNK